MDFSHVFNLRRWRSGFKGDVKEPGQPGHAPDATPDEVGAPSDNIGFDGTPLASGPSGNGQGTGDPRSPGWAGWGGMGSGSA